MQSNGVDCDFENHNPDSGPTLKKTQSGFGSNIKKNTIRIRIQIFQKSQSGSGSDMLRNLNPVPDSRPKKSKSTIRNTC